MIIEQKNTRQNSQKLNISCNFAQIKIKITMEITGKIIAVLAERGGVSQRTGTEWKAQEYVLETEEQYPKKICFDVFGSDKIANFAIKIGDKLTVSFDIDAREYQGRWYNSIRAWKVERVTEQQPVQPTDVPFPPSSAEPIDFSSNDSKDDLPF